MNEQLMNTMMNLIREGKNPEQLMINYLNSLGSPVGSNLVAMAKAGDRAGLENFARNLCAQSGRDFDTEFRAFKNQMGL